MSQQLDEKKYVIVPLIDQLRQYNSLIGSYDKSVMNSNFNYSVKLSNGRIEIVEELVFDYEKSPSHITEDRYKSAASKFISDTPPIQVQPQPTVVKQQDNKPIKKSGFKRALIIIVILIIGIAGFTIFWQMASNKGRMDVYKEQENQQQRERAEAERQQKIIELKNELAQAKAKLQIANNDLNKINQFQIGRSKSEKERQLSEQYKYIDKIKERIESINNQISILE